MNIFSFLNSVELKSHFSLGFLYGVGDVRRVLVMIFPMLVFARDQASR